MKDELEKKLREVEDEHFGEIEKTRIEDFDKEFIYEAHRFHGALGAVTSIARSLSSKMIEGLMQVEEKKYYLAWGYTRFADYLNSDEVPDLSKTKYYDLKALLLSEGADAFDVFSGKKIPVSTRKLLAAKGVEISVDGDDLVIADQRVPITDRAAMKELVETVHNVLRDRDGREEKLAKKVDDLSEQIRIGTDEYRKLERNLDALQKGDPHDIALTRCVSALVTLPELIGQMPDKRKAAAGETALPTLWILIRRIRQSYGTRFAFEENAPEATADLESIAAEVFVGEEDVDDV